MIAKDEQALSCDFAETYHVLDFRALPARRAAMLACGLRPSARIMMKLAGLPVPPEILLLAMIADATRTTMWLNTKDAAEGKNQPRSIASLMLKGPSGERGVGFDSFEDFNAWRASMFGGENNA